MPMLFSLLVLAIVIATLVDVIRRDNSMIKHLPKFCWILIVIMIPLIGSALWWAIGREYPEQVSFSVRPQRQAATPLSAPAREWTDPRSTEQQMADLDREIEEWRLREEIAKRAHRDDAGDGRAAS